MKKIHALAPMLDALAASQAALPVQEPVGYVKGTYAGRLIYDTINPAVCLPVGMALYTAPLPVQEPTGMLHIDRLDKWLDASLKERKQRQWIGLTKEDKFEIAEKLGLVSIEWLNLMRVIEAKLKERNCE